MAEVFRHRASLRELDHHYLHPVTEKAAERRVRARVGAGIGGVVDQAAEVVLTMVKSGIAYFGLAQAEILFGVLCGVPLLSRLVYLSVELVITFTHGRSKVHSQIFHMNT